MKETEGKWEKKVKERKIGKRVSVEGSEKRRG